MGRPQLIDADTRPLELRFSRGPIALHPVVTAKRTSLSWGKSYILSRALEAGDASGWFATLQDQHAQQDPAFDRSWDKVCGDLDDALVKRLRSAWHR